MNHLAHALLADDNVGLLLGGIAGNYFKGSVERIPDRGLRRGVRLHRRIDVYTDAHPACARSRARFVGARRRFAGIITDMVFDHFLAKHWAELVPSVELSTFTAQVYRTLELNAHRLPPALGPMLARMREHDWLGSYADLQFTGWSLDGLARRVRRGEVLEGAVIEVERAYTGLQQDFEIFFPELRAFAASERGRLSAEPPSGAIGSRKRASVQL